MCRETHVVSCLEGCLVLEKIEGKEGKDVGHVKFFLDHHVRIQSIIIERI